jgi:hypothetical protein
MTGLLTELPNKNCDTMAQAVSGTSEQRWQWRNEASSRYLPGHQLAFTKSDTAGETNFLGTSMFTSTIFRLAPKGEIVCS